MRALRWVVLLALGLALSGCSGLKWQTPERFKGKKQVEDPPLSFAPQAPRHEPNHV